MQIECQIKILHYQISLMSSVEMGGKCVTVIGHLPNTEEKKKKKKKEEEEEKCFTVECLR